MQFDQLMPVLNGLSTSIFLLNVDRRILFLNDAAQSLFGNGHIGADFVQAIRNAQCLDAVNKVLQGKDKVEQIITLQKPVKTTYKVTVSKLQTSNQSKDTDSSTLAICLENISHIFEAEQMRSEFVSNVSHELRSPLTALNGFIETLKGAAKNDPEAREHFLDIMEREAFRMNRLIGDLLSLSKVESEVHIRPQEKINLSDLLKQVIATLKPAAETENVTLTLLQPENFETLLAGDHDQLQQVFVNLIENAIKYGGPDREVKIALSQKNLTIGKRRPGIKIDIIDQGEGIKAEHIPRLTERFYRIDKGRSREKGGTGLGLAIVKHILTRHRGRLQITSKIGKGSVFSIFLAR